MPTLATVEGARIVMYFNDHPPPHVHATFAESRVKIGIEDLDVLDGRLPPAKLRQVLSWVERRKPALLQAWNDCRAGVAPARIE